jgi:hypothetical protein
VGKPGYPGGLIIGAVPKFLYITKEQKIERLEPFEIPAERWFKVAAA